MFFFLIDEKKCVNFFWSCSNEALDIHAFLKGSHNVNYTLKLNLFKYSKNADIAYESDKDASKPVARNFKLSNHSKQHMTACSLFLHLGSSESRKTLEQNFIF